MRQTMAANGYFPVREAQVTALYHFFLPFSFPLFAGKPGPRGVN